jgi:hypothetical protein
MISFNETNSGTNSNVLVSLLLEIGTFVERLWNVCGTFVERLWSVCGTFVERLVERLWNVCGTFVDRL